MSKSEKSPRDGAPRPTVGPTGGTGTPRTNRNPNKVTISLSRAEREVDIDGDTYTVKEMSGNELDKWRGTVGNRITTDSKGNSRVTNFEKFSASLISFCLYDKSGNLVPIETIASWPAMAQKTLFEICQEINGLTDEAEEAAKKD